MTLGDLSESAKNMAEYIDMGGRNLLVISAQLSLLKERLEVIKKETVGDLVNQ